MKDTNVTNWCIDSFNTIGNIKAHGIKEHKGKSRNSFNCIGDIKAHGIKEHKGKNTLYHYYRMGENDKFYAENIFTHKHLFSVQ